MKTLEKYGKTEEIPKTYMDLLRLFMLRPIHDETELENATEVMDLLAGHRLNKDQEDYLDALSTLTEEYESEHHHVPESKVMGIEALSFLLGENDMNASDLSRLLGCHRTLGPKILSGERRLTADHLRILSAYFKVSADLFF